jgi:sulfur carrier protein
LIIVNGETRIDLAGPITVSALLDVLDMPHRDRGVAVAVESAVVPRAEWDDQLIADGQRVEVLVAVQGG